MKKTIFCSILLFVIFFLHSTPKIFVNPTVYDFSFVKKGVIIKNQLKIKNNGDDILNINASSSCECLIVKKKTLQVKPDQELYMPFEFYTKTYSGHVSYDIILKTNDPEWPLLFINIKGIVITSEEFIDDFNSFDDDVITDNNIYNEKSIQYFTYLNCKSCIPITKKINEWSIKNNKKNELQTFDLTIKENQAKLYETIKELGSFPKLPLLIYDNMLYGGKEEIYAFLDNDELLDKKSLKKISFITIIIAGLLDGINPCAFTAIILLISYLSLNFKTRNRILFAGIFYTLAVFITYFLLGLGIFQFIKQFRHFQLISYILKYGLSISLFILAILSIYDFTKSLKGKNNEMLLKLPDFINNSMRKRIRFQMKDYNIFFGSIILGVLVSLFELACTGQVYFPVLGHMVRARNDIIKSFLLLTLYNVSFIIPMILVFIFTYIGFSSKQIGQVFSKNIPVIKFLFIILFIILGIINILY